jgi:hypothetical protein
MPVQAWLTMSEEMGIQNMGGPAVDFLPDLPAPTVTYGAVMQHDTQTGRMIGMKVGEMTGDTAGMDHSAMGHGARNLVSEMDSSGMAMLMAMHVRMMSDTGIVRHILADTSLRRMMVEMMPAMPDAHRERMEQMMRDTVDAPASGARRPPPARRPPAKPAVKPPAKAPPKADPHAGHKPPE